MIFVIMMTILSISLLDANSTTSFLCSINAQEYNALLALYSSTNEVGTCNNWIFSSNNPNYEAPCSSWYGITCNSQCQITELNLQSCQLTGSITSQLGYLISMTELYLDSNRLTGTIPSELGNLSKLQVLSLHTNSLSGTIPSQLGYLTSMVRFTIFWNSLSGTIPSQLGNMRNTEFLYINNISITGTIPSQLGYMTKMQEFDINTNSLTGTIPSELGNMTSMRNFYLFSNSLTGTIPSHLGSMAKTQLLWLYSNSLTGTIPSQLGYMNQMNSLWLYSNSLTGTIPSQIGNMTSMTNLYLYSNSFSGTIPSQIGSMSSLQYVWLYNNSLSGPIPVELANCKQLYQIYLQNNNLVGTLSPLLMSLENLTSINFSNNKLLGGSMGSIFSVYTSISLQYIIMATMALTGSIPDIIFQIPELSTLVLSSNCLSGTLSPGVCNSSVTSLVLDGAGVGSSCGSSRNVFQGTIPSCLFSNSNLSTLHLAGNGMIGTLPELSVSSTLQVLILAKNRLTGSIPSSLQMHTFVDLDLSSNRLSGELGSLLNPPSASLSLTVNRLSGNAPSTLRHTNTSVNILVGNLFGCPLLTTDEQSTQSSCGSRNLEFPFITWLSTLISILVAILAISNYSTSAVQQVKLNTTTWWETSVSCLSPLEVSTKLQYTKRSIKLLDSACSMLVILTVFLVTVVMTSLIAVKLQGASHPNSLYRMQYLYTTTAAYAVGKVPTVLVWLYVSLSGALVTVLCVVLRHTKDKTPSNDHEPIHRIEASSETSVTYKTTLVLLSIEAIMSAVAIGINVGFVQIVYFSKPSNLTAVQLAFATIKSIFSSIMVPLSTKLVPYRSRQNHSIFMTIMMTVISPGFAVLLSSPLCLFYKIKPGTVTASYEYTSSACNVNNCYYFLVTAYTSISPKWFYSYQCSSSFLVSYLPNFIYLYLIQGIVSPLVNFFTMLFISLDLSAKCKSPLALFVVRLAKNFKVGHGSIFYVADAPSVSSTEVEMSALHRVSESLDASITPKSQVSPARGDAYDVEVTGITTSLCVDITVVLTFGLASPLLAVIVSCSVIINVLLWRLAIGRYIIVVNKALGINACYERLERAFLDEWRSLQKSWWMMSIFIGMFWGLFMNDMIGDKNPTGGILAGVLMLVWCPLIFICLQKLSVDSSTETTSFSESVHNMIWKNIFRIVR